MGRPGTRKLVDLHVSLFWSPAFTDSLSVDKRSNSWISVQSFREFCGLLRGERAFLSGESACRSPLDWRPSGSTALSEWVVPPGPIGTSPSEQRELFARIAGCVFLGLATLAMAWSASTQAAISIAEEHEKGTLDSLLLTNVSPREIVLAKFLGVLASEVSLWIIALPFLAFATMFSNWPLAFWLLLAAGSLTTSTTATAIALASSARFQKVQAATGVAMTSIMFWLFSPMLVWVIATKSRGFGGPPFALLLQLLDFLTRSSPFAFVVLAAKGSPGTIVVERLLELAGLQIVLCLYLIDRVVRALLPVRPREEKAVATPLVRPTVEVGDDPIVWREYERTASKGALDLSWVMIKAIGAILKTLIAHLTRALFTAMLLVLVLMALLVPLAICWHVGKEAWASFLEFRENRFGWHGAAVLRDEFNKLVRMGAWVFGATLFGVASNIGQAICTERDKGTWLIFLTTPLSGQEIVQSKLLAVRKKALGLLTIGLSLAIVGLVCGASIRFAWLSPWRRLLLRITPGRFARSGPRFVLIVRTRRPEELCSTMLSFSCFPM